MSSYEIWEQAGMLVGIEDSHIKEKCVGHLNEMLILRKNERLDPCIFSIIVYLHRGPLKNNIFNIEEIRDNFYKFVSPELEIEINGYYAMDTLSEIINLYIKELETKNYGQR
jgi:hypothetical protein